MFDGGFRYANLQKFVAHCGDVGHVSAQNGCRALGNDGKFAKVCGNEPALALLVGARAVTALNSAATAEDYYQFEMGRIGICVVLRGKVPSFACEIRAGYE